MSDKSKMYLAEEPTGIYTIVRRAKDSIIVAVLVLVAIVISLPTMQFIAAYLAVHTITCAAFPLHNAHHPDIPPPPNPEPIQVVELPLPPVASSNETGSCTLDVNSRGTGCIQRELGDHVFHAGDFSPDGNHVVVNVNFVGAPEAPAPASIYDGAQLILVKADGTTFKNGDAWKCLSCAVPTDQQRLLDPQRNYPHVFRSGDKALWGHK
jgi:hypothetical protein